MKPIQFEGVDIVYGKGQPEYQELPAKQIDKNTVMTCWELSDEDIEQITKERKVWLGIMPFGRPLQPVLLSAFRLDIDAPQL